MSESLQQEMLEQLCARLMDGHRTFKDEYGPLTVGAAADVNDAFVVTKDVRAALLEADAKSENVLKPYLNNDAITKWHAEPVDAWIIHLTDADNLEDYPAIAQHLAPFREALEKNATSSKWYVQESDATANMAQTKIICLATSHAPTFAHEYAGALHGDNAFSIAKEDYYLAGALNSKLYWLMLQRVVEKNADGAYELSAANIEELPFPMPSVDEKGAVGRLSDYCKEISKELREMHKHVCQEIALHLGGAASDELLSDKLRNWHMLDIVSFSQEAESHFGKPIASDMLPAWEDLLISGRQQLNAINNDISRAEEKIDEAIYQLFGLSEEEVEMMQNLVL